MSVSDKIRELNQRQQKPSATADDSGTRFGPPKTTGPGGKYSTLPSKAFVFNPDQSSSPSSSPSPQQFKQFGQQQPINNGNATTNSSRSNSISTKPTGRPGIPDFNPPPPSQPTNQRISPPSSTASKVAPVQFKPAATTQSPQPKPAPISRPPAPAPTPTPQPTPVSRPQPPALQPVAAAVAPQPVATYQPQPSRGGAQAAPASPPQTPPAQQSTSSGEDMWHINFSELELGDVIGQGKYGEVSLGSYLGTPVAIKRILECNEETNQMIERELKILKEVRHPNIVQFLGATSHNNEIYIITEFMENGDLFDALIFGDTPLNWKKKLGIALDVAQACTYLQARGILHRDLKSQNILLSSNTKAKLCDLGLARAFDANNKRLTFVGSDRWMAPEIFMGFDYDFKADVFSYGVVLVELVTGQVPDERKPQKRFAFETEAFLKKVPSTCPPEFSRITVQCCATDPKDRPSFKSIQDRIKVMYESMEDEEEEEQEE
ncbi:LISK family protein kinase [Cavenderia fasciculata]|uniref:non-specific serine/threonine protein kinase n=1 Tax=Cavenderia fasciculata TaxID=261658 RepID=F4Q9I6_CACFS|nr:LISK family protein kinase [Cavenderia fasciculata]EGG15355.1 LISK family protein kinase [Cavenderia fasciculata]|eukprot:XP_004354097.1 LISK family protein kinase [Cavenderia fasciculata]